jgi:hypothetical protein
MDWHAFDDGATIGTRGSEHGIIVVDEEHLLGARLTLEENADNAPWSITCGVYWLMFHTRFFADRQTAEAEYAAMKSGIDTLMDQLNAADLSDLSEQGRLAGEFVERFP